MNKFIVTGNKDGKKIAYTVDVTYANLHPAELMKKVISFVESREPDIEHITIMRYDRIINMMVEEF